MQNTTHQYDTLHPYAEILRAIADGKQIEYKSYTGEWCEIDNATALGMLSVATNTDFRVKREVILINCIEVPKPCCKPPKLGSTYYYPYLEGSDGNKYSCVSWDNDSYDNRLLKLGLVHLTKEAADKHAEALLSFTQVNAAVQQ